MKYRSKLPAFMLEAAREYKNYRRHMSEEELQERQDAMVSLLENNLKIITPKRYPSGMGNTEYHGQFCKGNGNRWIRPKVMGDH